MNKPIKFGSKKKSEPTTESKEEAAPEVPEVDPVMEARDVDEGALDKPHDEEVKEEEKPTTEEAKEESTTPPVEEESRDAEPSFPETEEKEETPAEEEEDTSIRTEPSSEVAEKEAADTEPVVEEEKNVDPALSTVEEKEEPSKDEPVADEPSEEMKKERTMNIDTVPVSDEEDEPTLETKDTMDDNLLKGCVTPVMKATDFCGINIRTCFE